MATVTVRALGPEQKASWPCSPLAAHELTFMPHSICATYLGPTIPREEAKVIPEALISTGEFQNCSNQEPGPPLFLDVKHSWCPNF